MLDRRAVLPPIFRLQWIESADEKQQQKKYEEKNQQNCCKTLFMLSNSIRFDSFDNY